MVVLVLGLRDSAIRFVEFKRKKIREDKWVSIFCDNLSTHLDDGIRNICGDDKVLLHYFLPNMTNFIHAIDAGLGICVTIYIGCALDD